jgi:GT2 family glycosyltransferase
MLSIGILTYNSPITLKNSLESYKIGGLLDYTDDITCLIQPSNKSEEEIQLCKQYNIKYINEQTNTMMAGAIKTLVEKSNYEYLLFLESDFRLCKNRLVTKTLLDFAIK